jgi:ribosomal protein L11 methylase PrmA
MTGTYIVALELVSRIEVEVEADNDEDAIQVAFTNFDANFQDYTTEIQHGEWDAEVVDGPEEEEG